MKIIQVRGKDGDLDGLSLETLRGIQPQIGFIFGSVNVFENSSFIKRLRAETPGTQWMGCSTAGEISAAGVTDNTLVATAIHFENPQTKFKVISAQIDKVEHCEKAGRQIGSALNAPDLTGVIVLGPGVAVNGSALVTGISSQMDQRIPITGGLAGDAGGFKKTYTMHPEGVSDRAVVAMGIYGKTLELRHGCMGGWELFGKVRQVSKSFENVMYELDGEPALGVYEKYLGERAKDLPASGLLFPFAILDGDQAETGLIRTILGIDREQGTLIFAGDIPEGGYVRLMHSTTAGLATGAKESAKQAAQRGVAPSAFALIVSCVGRKLVMGVNVDEEIEAISEVLGSSCALAGFYSYGEISPHLNQGASLHNQTMTISYLVELP